MNRTIVKRIYDRWFRTLYRHSSTGIPETEYIKVKQHGNNAFEVILNRPEERNAFTVPFWIELRKVFDALSSTPSCRAIVLSAAGKSFCTGIDLNEGMTEIIKLIKDDKLDVGRKSMKLREMIALCQDSYTSLERCRKPVIAAIHGHCIGGGISLAACADIRYATNDTVFSIREVDVGLAADVGILNRISRIVANDSLTRELAFTARDFNASEAFQYGFISRYYETVEKCQEAALHLAVEIAAKSPIAVQGTKLTLNYARDHPTEDSLNFVRTLNQCHLQSEDLVLAATAKISKQKVEFSNI